MSDKELSQYLGLAEEVSNLIHEAAIDGLPRHGYVKDNNWGASGRMYRHRDGHKTLVFGAGSGNKLEWTHWDKHHNEKSGRTLARLTKHLDKVHAVK